MKIAIEISITTTQEDEKNNIIKDLESGADFVIIACQKDKIAEINKMIASLDIQYREKTYSCLLPELLKTNDLLSIVKSEKST